MSQSLLVRKQCEIQYLLCDIGPNKELNVSFTIISSSNQNFLLAKGSTVPVWALICFENFTI